MFAGYDISVCLGKNELKTKYLNKYEETKLKKDELVSLNEWLVFY